MENNKYVGSLINLINAHKKDFIDILLKKPYNLKSVKNCTWHNNWYMFNYNIFSSDLRNDVVRACRGIVLSIDKIYFCPLY